MVAGQERNHTLRGASPAPPARLRGATPAAYPPCRNRCCPGASVCLRVPPPAVGCSRHGVMRRRRPASRSVSFSPSQTARRTDSNVFYVALLRFLPALLPAGVITRFHSVYGRESFSLDTSRRAAPQRVPSGGQLYARERERPTSCRRSFTVIGSSIHPFFHPSGSDEVVRQRER